MKASITLLVLVALMLKWSFADAQAPNLINYEGVARNGSEILSNKTISLQFIIHDATSEGAILYQEYHQGITTNAEGLFITQIGNGTLEAGVFANIPWQTNDKYLEVDIDTSGGMTFIKLGITQLVSVPYSLHANGADTAAYAYSAPATKFNAGAGINIADGLISLADTGHQLLSLSESGDSLTISKGNVISLGALVPPGTIQAYGGTTAPVGWLMCDGSLYANSDYTALQTVIGQNFGGNGTHFNVPDLRGMFLRGVNGNTPNNEGLTASSDPEATSRVSYNGGNSGNKVGSYQADTLKSHSHTITDLIANGYVSGAGGSEGTWVVASGSTATNTSGGVETRPKNVYVNYIIKY